MNKLNKELKEQAIELGLCNDWQEMWKRGWNLQDMAKRMYEGINFCMEHHWPTCEFIRENFTQSFRRSVGVLADDTYSMYNPEKALILGTSISTLRFNGTGKGEIYVRDYSKVIVSAKGHSRVYIQVYDNAIIEADAHDQARLVVVRCSPNVTVNIKEGNAIVRDKKK